MLAHCQENRRVIRRLRDSFNNGFVANPKKCLFGIGSTSLGTLSPGMASYQLEAKSKPSPTYHDHQHSSFPGSSSECDQLLLAFHSELCYPDKTLQRHPHPTKNRIPKSPQGAESDFKVCKTALMETTLMVYLFTGLVQDLPGISVQ